MNPNPYIDEDLQALADTARRFAEERVKPGFLERDQTRDLDRVLLREMGELGFICPELPEQFGGLGLGCLAAGVIHEEIARADLRQPRLDRIERALQPGAIPDVDLVLRVAERVLQIFEHRQVVDRVDLGRDGIGQFAHGVAILDRGGQQRILRIGVDS